MKTRLCLLLVLLLCFAAPSFAHRLNEYLQATTISLEKEHLTLQLRLTPGVDVSQKVLAVMDTNSDGTISSAEERAYAEQVRQDLAVTIDGKLLLPRLASSSFPDAAQIKGGVGDVLLTFDAELPEGSSARRLTVQNRHQKSVAAYLVNCLMPRDPSIHVVAQSRSYDQSFYQLDFTTGGVQVALSRREGPSQQQRQQQQLDQSDALAVSKTYVWHGIHHILTGYDHLLFLGALVLAATSLWNLVKVVTAFTVAHSITLTLAALNLVHLPGRIVEPFIALSIVFVALQNLFWTKHSRGGCRLAVAFFFGLFHGLGFAGGLLDIMHHMERGTVLLTILGFSIGVEAGNQMVLLTLFGLLKVMHHSQRDEKKRAQLATQVQRIGSVGVAVAGMYYLCIALTGSS